MPFLRFSTAQYARRDKHNTGSGIVDGTTEAKLYPTDDLNDTLEKLARAQRRDQIHGVLMKVEFSLNETIARGDSEESDAHIWSRCRILLKVLAGMTAMESSEQTTTKTMHEEHDSDTNSNNDNNDNNTNREPIDVAALLIRSETAFLECLQAHRTFRRGFNNAQAYISRQHRELSCRKLEGRATNEECNEAAKEQIRWEAYEAYGVKVLRNARRQAIAGTITADEVPRPVPWENWRKSTREAGGEHNEGEGRAARVVEKIRKRHTKGHSSPWLASAIEGSY